MIFSAIAKEKGHATSMIIESNVKKAVSKALLQIPDLIVFSNITSGNINFAYRCACLIKLKCDIPILVGGVFISLNHKHIDMKHIDMLGVGEGELMFSSLLDTHLQKRFYSMVPGLIYKNHDCRQINPPEFIQDIDKIPFLDRTLYYSYRVLRKEKVRMFYSGRGCRYNCSYCCVPILNRMDTSVQTIRRRSPYNLLNEILDVNNRWGMKAAFFQDDTFTQNIEWLEEFLPLYKKHVDKPFMCMTRANDIMRESTVDLLYKTGCKSVGIGIETANECIRYEYLNRKETNESILNTARYLQERKIRITTFNMIGIPKETLSDVNHTLEFNQKLKVNSAWAVFYQPYTDENITDIKKFAQNSNFYSKLPGEHPDKNEMELIQKLFPYLVKYPVVSRFLHLKTVKYLSYFLFALHSFYREIHIWHRSFFLTLLIGIKNQLQYKKMNKEEELDD